MNDKFQKRVQRYGWDLAAASYEKSWQRQLLPAQRRLLELTNLKAGEAVLDVACGTGLVSFPAAEMVGPGGKVIGTDISDRMIEISNARAAAMNMPQLSFRQMDGEALQFEDNRFDAAISALGLLYFPDPLASLREMFRVLRPGGRAVAAVWGDRGACGWADIFPIVDSRVNSDVCPLFFQLGTADMLKLQFEAAGFRSVTLERISTTLRYADAATAVGAVFAGGPVALAYSRFDDATRESAHQEYLESVAKYRNGDGYEIPGEFVVVVGTR